MDKIIEFVTNNALIENAMIVVGAFATIATITPNKADDKIINLFLKAINFLGANFGKSKNEDK